MRRIFVLVLIIPFFSCQQSPEPADLILYNGNIYTLTWPEPDREGNPSPGAPYADGVWTPDATAIAVVGGKIYRIGDDTETLVLRGEKTIMIDLDGAAAYPGFVESHTHPFNLGAKLERIDLVGVESEEESVNRIVENMGSTPKGQWVIGVGFDDGAWINNLPDKTLLTERMPDHPVFMNSLHGFAAWVNQAALDRMGIDRNTPDPVGGHIGRDENGEPNGQFYDNATDLIHVAIPAPSSTVQKRTLTRGLEELARSGFTSNHQAGVDSDQMEVLMEMEQDDKLPIRLYGMIRMTDTALANEWLERGPETDTESMFTVRSCKAFYDGSLGVRGARLLEDYSDRPGHRGASGANYGFDKTLVKAMMARGFQMNIHAIGDAANREVLDFFEGVFREYPASKSNRNRIEHAQVVHPDDFVRFANLKIIASMEPPHMAEDKQWAENRIGPDRIKGAYAWRTMRRQGVEMTFNSDLPGSDWNVFYGMHSAITRTDKEGQPSGGWYPEQKMSPEETLRAYTVWASYSGFMEDIAGTLAEGKFADITVTDIDILNIGHSSPGSLLDGQIVMTIVAGNVVYKNELFSSY